MNLTSDDYEGYGVYAGYGAQERPEVNMCGALPCAYGGMGETPTIPGVSAADVVATSRTGPSALQVLTPAAQAAADAALPFTSLVVPGLPQGAPLVAPSYPASAAVVLGLVGHNWVADVVQQGYAVTATVASITGATGTVDFVLTKSPSELVSLTRSGPASAPAGAAVPAASPNVIVSAPSGLVAAAHALLDSPAPPPAGAKCPPDMVMTPAGCRPHGKGVEPDKAKPSPSGLPDWAVPVGVLAVLAVTAFALSDKERD